MGKRSYNQYCALARGLDVIGERWTLLIVRELLIGPKRFKDLLDGLVGMGTNLLSARLKDMLDSGIIERTILPPPAGSTVYRLTKRGQQLETPVLALIRWGFSLLADKKSNELSRPEWDIVAVKAAFNPEKAKGINESYELHVDGAVFNMLISNGFLEVSSGPTSHPNVILTTDGETLANVGLGRKSLKEVMAGGDFKFEGSKKAVKQMIDIFSMGQTRD